MKNVITYLKTLWRRGLGSQSSDIGFDCRLTVGSPSVKCGSTLMRLVAISAFLLTIGSGNAWGATATATLSTLYDGWTTNTSVNNDSKTFGTYFTVTWTKEDSPTNPTYLNNKDGNGVKLYATKNTTKGGKITISTSSAGVYITNIAITGKQTQGTVAFYWDGNTSTTGNSHTYTEGSKTQSANARLKETAGSKNGQYHITSVTVTYVIAASCDAPNAPTNSSVSGTGVTISTSSSSANYDIYYSTSSTTPTTQDPTATISSGNSKAITGLSYGTTYYYWMRQNCGGGSTSSWVAGSPATFTTTVPAPTGVSAGSLTMDGATFTITDANNVNSYDVYCSESSTAPVAGTTPSASGSSKSIAVTGLTAGRTYYYWARAKGPNVKSDWVGGSTFTTLTLSSISVSTAPTKTKYLVGDNFDPTGLVITRTYSNSTSDTYSYAGHTGDFSFSPATNAALTAGDDAVTITYGGKSVSQSINVYSVTVNKVDMDGNAIADAGVTASCSGRTLSQSVSTTNYKFNSWVLATASGTSLSTNTLTGTPTGNVVVNAKFHKPITVTWKVGSGAASGGTGEVKYGTAIAALPSTPADNALASCGTNKFMGWTALGELKGTGNDAPADLFTTVGGAANLTTNTTYRAVFASSTSGAAANTVLFSENWTGVSASTTPSSPSASGSSVYGGASISYSWSSGSGTSTTQTYTDGGPNGDENILIAKSNGYWKVTGIKTGNASKIVFTYAKSGSGTVSVSSPTSNVSVGGSSSGSYITFTDEVSTFDLEFKNTNGGNNLRLDDIEVKVYTAGTTAEDYQTGCCTALGYVKGSVTFVNPTKAVLVWDKMSNVDATTPYTITYRTGSDPYGSSNVSSIRDTISNTKKTCVITGLSCNTSYDFKIAVTAASNYCDKDTTMTGKNSGTWSVTSTIVNGTKTDVPTTACGDYEAEFAASDGYHFPAKASITVTGASDFSWNSSTGVLSIDGDDITGNISISITCPPDACSDWGFYYGTDKVADWAYECFTKVKPADATDHEWQTDEIALPNKPNWYVDNASEDDGKKKVVTWGDLYFAMSQGSGTRPMVGTATGATGKVRIYDNWDWNNRAAGFLPTGYVMKFGSNEYAFDFVASNEYRTGIVNLNSTTYADAVSVGIEDGNGDYVSTGNTEALRHIFFVPSAAWKTGSAKFCIHYWDGGSLNARSDYMSAVPGKSGWYEGWLPAAATGFQFERQNPAGDSPTEGNRWTAGADQTLQSNKNCYTMTASGGESDWDGTVTTSLYTSKGKFRMWDNSTSKNWYVTFYPHYVLHYDANSGSGEPADQSVALDASPCQLTVSSTAPTRDGYTFLGWNESSSATTPDGDWDGGDTHAMTGDVTLYAVWAANHTLTYNYNGGDGSSCSGGTKYTGESFTACNNPGDKTGHSFTGWLGSNSTSYTAGTTYSMPDADLTLTAQWSANSYDVTLTTNGGTINAGNVTSYTYGVGATLPTNVTRDGYRFDGWFTDDGVWSDQVTAISTTATGDKTYYAKWTKVHTVTWKVNGSTYETGVVSGNSQVANGEQISAMATAPANNTLSCSSKFMGWSVTNIPAGTPVNGSSNISALGLFTTVGSSPTITKDTVFYAVFAKQTNSDGYKYIGDAGTLADGEKYIFVDSKTAGSGHALKASDLAENSSAGKKGTAVSVSITSNAEGILITTENSALEFEYVSTGTKLKYTDGLTTKYLFINGNGVGYKTGDSRSAYGTHQLYGWTNGYANRYVYYDGTNENFTISEDAQNMYAYIKQTPAYGDYRVQCDPNIVTVTYDGNSGSTTCENEEHDKRNDYTVCSSAPTRDYYTFAGWLCSADSKTYAANATIDADAIDADFTLTAQWTPVSYSISYNLNGGTNSADPISAYNVETTSALPTPTKGHDRFDGWYTDDGVWSNQVSSITAGMHGNLTLYAKWTSRYEIVFDVYGGSTTTIYRAADENLESAVAGQGSKPSDPDAPSTCSTKTFVGWVESEIDDETDTKPATLTNATGAATANKHYYATWALKSGSDIDAAEDNSFTTSGTETYCGMTNGMKDAGDYILKNSVWSTDLSGSQVKIKVYHLSNKTADVLRISLVNSSGTEVVGTDLTTTALGTSSSSADYSSYVTLTPNSTVTGYKVALKTKNSYGTCVDKVTREVVATYSKYATSCCGTKVTLSENSPEHGTIVFGKTSVGTCGGDKEVSLTITPAAGYQLATYSVATGDGKVGTKTDPGVSLNNNSSAAQNITLTFEEDSEGAYDVTASFSLMTVTSWTWTMHDGGGAIPDPLNLYVGQRARLDVAYTPSGVDASKKTYTRDKTSTYINWVGSLYSGYSTIEGRASTGENTTPVTFTHADGPETIVNVKVLPLPLTHFEDLVHGKSFDDVVATLSDNALSATKTTPTSDDWTTPNANECEENHLHLVGWIRSDWPALVAYLNGTGDAPATTAIVGAGNDGSGNAYFFAPNASINVLTFNGATFYAVWAEIK